MLGGRKDGRKDRRTEGRNAENYVPPLFFEKAGDNNLRIISQPHAYGQTMSKTHVKFQKNQYKTVGGDAHTRWYPLFIHFDSKNARKMAKFNFWKK